MFCKNFIRKIAQIWCVINTKICCPASSDFCTNFFAPSACCSTFLIFVQSFPRALLPHLLIFFSLAFSCFVFKPLLLVVMPQMITAQPLTQSLNFIFFLVKLSCFPASLLSIDIFWLAVLPHLLAASSPICCLLTIRQFFFVCVFISSEHVIGNLLNMMQWVKIFHQKKGTTVKSAIWCNVLQKFH